jgi:hypothetical protein
MAAVRCNPQARNCNCARGGDVMGSGAHEGGGRRLRGHQSSGMDRQEIVTSWLAAGAFVFAGEDKEEGGRRPLCP